MSASDSTDAKLAEALAECERLRQENRRLRQRYELAPIEAEFPSLNGLAEPGSTAATVTAKSTPDDKLKLFRDLFRGCEDVSVIEAALNAPGSRARNGRGALSLAKFGSIGRRVWPATRYLGLSEQIGSQ